MILIILMIKINMKVTIIPIITFKFRPSQLSPSHNRHDGLGLSLPCYWVHIDLAGNGNDDNDGNDMNHIMMQYKHYDNDIDMMQYTHYDIMIIMLLPIGRACSRAVSH